MFEWTYGLAEECLSHLRIYNTHSLCSNDLFNLQFLGLLVAFHMYNVLAMGLASNTSHIHTGYRDVSL